MITDNRKLGQDLGQESTATCCDPVDFDFLATQTFDDSAFETEILQLFVAQAARLLPTLPRLPPREQADTAHLLKGSARGIGAFPLAEAAARYEAAEPAARAKLYPALAAAASAVEEAISARLGTPNG